MMSQVPSPNTALELGFVDKYHQLVRDGKCFVDCPGHGRLRPSPRSGLLAISLDLGRQSSGAAGSCKLIDSVIAGIRSVFAFVVVCSEGRHCGRNERDLAWTTRRPVKN